MGHCGLDSGSLISGRGRIFCLPPSSNWFGGSPIYLSRLYQCLFLGKYIDWSVKLTGSPLAFASVRNCLILLGSHLWDKDLLYSNLIMHEGKLDKLKVYEFFIGFNICTKSKYLSWYSFIVGFMFSFSRVHRIKHKNVCMFAFLFQIYG